ncbi:MAG: hypothetical protein ACR2N3_04725 [Pyrinomonadaceae bacterium]
MADTKSTPQDEELTERAASGSTEVEPGVFEGPDGLVKPQHYPAAVVIDDKFEGGHTKTPDVTPEEFNNKMNPADAKTTDSEFIVHAGSLDEAQKLMDAGRSELPKEAQDPEASSK